MHQKNSKTNGYCSISVPGCEGLARKMNKSLKSGTKKIMMRGKEKRSNDSNAFFSMARVCPHRQQHGDAKQ